MVGGFYLAIACIISATAAVKEYPYETDESENMGLYDALNMLTDLQSLIETELDKKSGGYQIKKNTEDYEDDEELLEDQDRARHQYGNRQPITMKRASLDSACSCNPRTSRDNKPNIMKLLGKQFQERLSKLREKEESPSFYNNMLFRPSSAKTEHLINSVGK
ncbi:uncharacterized protein LOC111718113 isoform X2 [Eurytemora carolleeae]|nr:uncharacterized protein LOC111718113 isoform X2 [Eurytemora carolleeae]|eukprot:XP_023349387.1 uncharacterized protein LOC111718113 isoform X2 [Eurytemora affinis]